MADWPKQYLEQATVNSLLAVNTKYQHCWSRLWLSYADSFSYKPMFGSLIVTRVLAWDKTPKFLHPKIFNYGKQKISNSSIIFLLEFAIRGLSF